jgi:hypothetical protein
MTAYLLGNLLGRLAISYVIVWLATWLLLARLDWRATFRRTTHWIGLLATAVTFLLGLLTTLSTGAAP